VIRFIVAVVVGYACMFVLVAAAFAPAMVAPDLAFRAGTAEVTSGWLVYALVASLVAAAVGGFVAAHIARSRRAAVVLAVLVFVLGLASAVANEMRERPPADVPAEMTPADRASRAVQPTWYAFAMPLLGAAGAVAGGRARRGRGSV
jgi:hypothetical protein